MPFLLSRQIRLRISFGDWAGVAGPDGFQYPAYAVYNFIDLRQYNHGSLILSIGKNVVGGGSSSEKNTSVDGEIRLIVNDSDDSNNDGQFSVNLKVSGYRLYKNAFK